VVAQGFTYAKVTILESVKTLFSKMVKELWATDGKADGRGRQGGSFGHGRERQTVKVDGGFFGLRQIFWFCQVSGLYYG
jgi:hypothetical protein